ncbi:hypothetical protein [Yinghuangia seranimata]|uniref:hypothetical protein n=1 Tax=Yinghuangia seranimata TaxID=408067 RepID=UPI00248B5B41|nr:hypothetical protein [Yinghuangia seranimata]MDI2131233.1 hypothetical protein [Yinghuangia seranimata]
MSTLETSPVATRPARADQAVRVGAVLFGIGTVAVVVTLVPFLIGTHPFPRAVYLTSALMPLGFAVAMGGLVATVVGQRRRV